MKNFVIGRIKSLYFAIKGMFLLFTEDAIIAHTLISTVLVASGFYFGITKTEWLIQIILIGLVFISESLNTAIEEVCNFIHPDFHEKVGFIKDISAGAVSFAVLFSFIGTTIIYYPYIKDLFVSL